MTAQISTTEQLFVLLPWSPNQHPRLASTAATDCFLVAAACAAVDLAAAACAANDFVSFFVDDKSWRRLKVMAMYKELQEDSEILVDDLEFLFFLWFLTCFSVKILAIDYILCEYINEI
ncbi:hypothetical protein L1887_23900 [Cichorium endivia]|nr:hypothetical protein L1887_23900 [Cichorium endivia]